MSATDPIAGKEGLRFNMQPGETGNEYDLDQESITRLLEFFLLLDRWDREQHGDSGAGPTSESNRISP